jgi:hypothetical protein
MKIITVSLDDETYRIARMRAAELGMSVSALVKRYLMELGPGQTEFQRQEQALRARVQADFRAADNLIRDHVHERGA